MSFELSSIITHLQKEGTSVAHSGKTNAQLVTTTLQQRFGDSAPDFLGLQLGLVELVENDLGRLLTTDATHVHGVVGNRLQIQERDAAFAATFEVLSAVRSAVEGVYGEASRVELFGDVSALPSDPLELHRLGARVQEQLRGEQFVLPAVRLPGFPPLVREELADGLKQPLDRLGQVLATLSLERKDADVTLLEKTEGIEEFRRTVRFAAGCFASLYGLAGLDDLAAKIRPKRRTPRRPNGSGPDTGNAPSGPEPGVAGTGSDGSDSGSGNGPDSGPASESSDEGDEAADPSRRGPLGSGPIGIVR